MASAIRENCEIESDDIINPNKVCKCISDKYSSMRGELKDVNGKLNSVEKDFDLSTKKLKVFYEEFVTLECEMNDESPQLCGVNNLKVDKENRKVIKVFIDENSYHEPEDMTELEILHSEIKFLPFNIFEAMPLLDAFTVINSSLTVISRGSFKGAHVLEAITIEGNNIKHLGPNIFEGAETVQHLLLSENRIHTVSEDAFNGLVKLKVLSLRGNKIKKLDTKIFTNNIVLRKLTFSHNLIEKIDDDLLIKNPRMIYLKFDHNSLSSFDQTKLIQYADKDIVADFSGQTIVEFDGENTFDEIDERGNLEMSRILG